ncbi:MAG: CDP-alcohol phosphatidyltransferase family protein [Bacteroidales bacterium]|nr:CDP-alcohol phosphatidyltransferase family protein [Bacteroidales bacterium]
MTDKKAERIQTSFLNGIEKKALVWLAARQPKWMVSDMLTFIGTLGAIVIAAGYILSSQSIHFLWLSSLGFIINWYGDSLDGTLARVRDMQRPIYGYYIDHTVDCINEAFMFLGVGLSPLMNLPLALMILVVYLFLTINVSVNAHLKGEFKLTYLKLGPTEFRVFAILVNTLFILVRPLRDFSQQVNILGHPAELRALDVAGTIVLVLLVVIYLITIISDARAYAKADPMPEKKKD